MSEKINEVNNDESSQQPQTTQETDASNVRVASVEVATYVVQWRLLLVGIIILLLCVGVAGGIYFFRLANLSDDIITTSNELLREANEIRNKATREYGNDKNSIEYTEAIKTSYEGKLRAASLLKSIREKKQDDIGILKKYNEVLESLLIDEAGTGAVQVRRRREIIENCKDLMRTLNSTSEILPYQKRIMDLEWELRNTSEVINNAVDIYQRDITSNNKENYDALRYIALASFQKIAAGVRYEPVAGFSHTYYDELLDKVYKMREADLEIATCYAGFIIDVDNKNFSESASDTLKKQSEEQRVSMAQNIIDKMVDLNKDSVLAYLTRYNFNSRFDKYIQKRPFENKLDNDLDSVLKIDPDNAEGLILAGRYTFRQAVVARLAGQARQTEELREKALNYLKRAVDKNPSMDIAYQFLGDFYQSNGDTANAIRTWEKGIDRSLPYANPELVGRVVIAFISTKEFEKARKVLSYLDSYLVERNMAYLQRIKDIRSFLNARLDAYEAWALRAKAMSIQDKKDPKNAEEVKRLFAASVKKLSDATQMLKENLPNASESYAKIQDSVFESASIYSQIVSESGLLFGRLLADQGKLDLATEQYKKAAEINRVAQAALVAASGTLQQQGKTLESLKTMEQAVARDMNNVVLRFLYTQSLFRYCMSANTVTAEDLDKLRDHLLYLKTKREELTAPWIIDIALVQIEITRATLTNDSNVINKATADAVKQFKQIEKIQMPPQYDKDGNLLPRTTYSQHLQFMASIASIYASALQKNEYERVLSEIRSMKDGEYTYFAERIRDATRRGDNESIVDIITNEVQNSDKLTVTQKERFQTLIQPKLDNDIGLSKRVYDVLKTTFDNTPEIMGPSSLFTLANYEVDNDNIEKAEDLMNRIKVLEGEATGTFWRYINARILLRRPNPPIEELRELQRVIVAERKDWDFAYLLKAAIEEAAVGERKMNPETERQIIEAYREAINRGNLQPMVWGRFIAMLETSGRTDEARTFRVTARLQNIPLDSEGIFPQPYQRMFNLVADQVNKNEIKEADKTAQRCITLAESRSESSEFIASLHRKLGKLFLDHDIFDSAIRHLRTIADAGGINVYPLAVTMAKANRVDDAFILILDEIDRFPASAASLLASTLILLEQKQPSEKVYERIDRLMNRIENGERLTLSGNEVPEDKVIDIGERKIYSIVIQFTDSNDVPAINGIEFFAPEEYEEENEDEEELYDDK
jgi:lipopolysaccharide biosynthesis regulator YciM